MLAIKVIPNLSKVTRVIVEPTYSAICSIVKEEFHGSIIIDYYPQDNLLELCSLDEWLRSVASIPMTVEDLCRLMHATIRAALGDIRLRVEVRAETTVHAPVRAIITSGGYNETEF